MRILAITLLVLGAVIVTYAVTRFSAFFDFSPNRDSESAGFIQFSRMLTPLGWGLVTFLASAVCAWLSRKRKPKG